MDNFNRRAFLQAAAIAGGTCVAAGTALAAPAAAAFGREHGPGHGQGRERVRTLAPRNTWAPAPEQVPVIATVASLPGGARLWYWDTGGIGEPIVLAHPATGSGLSWEYQQPVFANAGHRVIGYSSRGRYGSDPVTADNIGTGSGDLHDLVEYLGLERFHLVGVAAGGGIALDYAISHQDRLRSLVIASSFGSVADPDFAATTRDILPPIFGALPPDFRELGPSYRAAYRPGVTRWLELHAQAGNVRSGQPTANQMLWPAVETVQTPTLLMTGDADLYMPPWRLRDFATHLPNSDITVFGEVGHNAFWEQPELFNRELLRFFKKHCRHY